MLLSNFLRTWILVTELVVFFVLVGKDGDGRLELRLAGTLKQYLPEYRREYGLAAAGILTVFFPFELLLDVIDLFFFESMRLQIFALPDQIKLGSWLIAALFLAAASLYYRNAIKNTVFWSKAQINSIQN